METTRQTGNKGEHIAVQYLLQQGFTILHTNWIFGHKELDIVASKDNILHIVEVKTRSTQFWEEPKDAVVRRKQKNIIEAADAYINKFNIDTETQFDIVSIILNGNNCQIEFIPNAFSTTL